MELCRISHDLTNLHAVVLVRNSLQGSLVEINYINCAAGSQQLSQGNREYSFSGTKIAP